MSDINLGKMEMDTQNLLGITTLRQRYRVLCSVFPALITINNLYDKEGNLIGGNNTVRDVTEVYTSKKQHKELKLKLKKTETVNKKLANAG